MRATRPQARSRWFWAVLCASAATVPSGCTTPATEIIVSVTTDFRVPEGIDAVEFALGPELPTKARVKVMSADDFPLTWVISTGGETQSVAVDVRGMLGNGMITHATAVRAFKAEASRELRVDLWRACAGVRCGADEYCDKREALPVCVSLFDDDAVRPVDLELDVIADADGGMP